MVSGTLRPGYRFVNTNLTCPGALGGARESCRRGSVSLERRLFQRPVAFCSSFLKRERLKTRHSVTQMISPLVWEFSYMRRFFLILALVFTVTMLLQPRSQAGIFIGFPIPLPVPVFYGPAYYSPGYYYGPYGYAYYARPYWRHRYWARGHWWYH